MHQFMPGYNKALAEAILQLHGNPKLHEVVFSNGSGLRLTRDDAYGQAKREKGAKCIGTQSYKEKTYLIFAP